MKKKKEEKKEEEEEKKKKETEEKKGRSGSGSLTQTFNPIQSLPLFRSSPLPYSPSLHGVSSPSSLPPTSPIAEAGVGES